MLILVYINVFVYVGPRLKFLHGQGASFTDFSTHKWLLVFGPVSNYRARCETDLVQPRFQNANAPGTRFFVFRTIF